MAKSYAEINEKIKNGKAVVLTAEEISELSKSLSPKEIAAKVDVVTTGTFGAMCSSGAFINFGHADPPIRMEKIELNGVRVSGGLAAVDTYIGATDCNPERPAYGGAHLIQELIEGKDITLEAWGKGTDCYPRKHIKTIINRETINEAILYNPRNAYQNYNVATNTTDQIKYTYMGTLLPRMRNASYSTAGELSPLLNDPECRTIGLGTRIFLCGTEGYVSWNGTQFHTGKETNAFGIPTSNARTIAVIGDLKNMSADFLRAAYYEKYGVSMFVGIGIPIPILDEDMASRVSIRNEQIETTVVDYGNGNQILGKTNYAALHSGEIEINGHKVRTAPVASLAKAREIAGILKSWIQQGRFLLSEPVRPMPIGTNLKSLQEIKKED
ncbi:homocysteine biosynthesis protein [uncultured Odoribacter sp.]|uniref:homocysteine biosynthesis protein n=1 Tax=uncultured Odoribacter sp. TaxID=876416 RepID=UPI002630E361|nr:homocysteine biosynthesis protein [uncultured Odoribacter sp.]